MKYSIFLFFVLFVSQERKVEFSGDSLSYSFKKKDIHEVNIKGNAFISDGETFIKAREIGLIEYRVSKKHKRYKAYAKGRVIAYSKEKSIFLYGDSAIWYSDKGFVEVLSKKKKVFIVKKGANGFSLSGEKVFFFTKDRVVRVVGNVLWRRKGLVGRASELFYYDKKRKAVLIGKAYIRNKRDVYKADRIEVFDDEKVVVFKGNVKIVSYDKKGKKIEAICGFAKYQDSKDIMVLKEEPLILYDYMSIQGKTIYLYKKKRQLKAYGDVVFFDKKNKRYLYAERLFYDDLKREIRAFPKKGNRILVKVISKKEGINIYGKKFYGDLKKDKYYIIEDVELVKKDYRLYGYLAVVSKNTNKALVYGEPKIVFDKGVIFSDKLNIYGGDKKRAILEGNIYGNIFIKKKGVEDGDE